ncbi:MAG: hypothetical protein AB1Z23_00815 [Eubacteriales bacterium]
MDIKKALEAFGQCYNNKSFFTISRLLRPEVSYDSYDCLYNITSIDSVVKILDESIKQNTEAYEGYYFWKSILTRRLSKCVLICDSDTLKCIRIINIKIRKRKITRITGLNPREYEYTRGKKIAG